MRTPRQAGFTVIELLVVVVIAAILAAIAVPSFNGMMEKRRLEGAANELSADLQFARSQAVADNTNVTFATTGTSGYTISGNQTYKTQAFDASSGLSVTSGVSIVFAGMRGCITDNTCTAADATVTVSNTSGSLQATVNRMGRVSLCVPSGSSFAGYSSC